MANTTYIRQTRDAVATILRGVSGIGLVHTRTRYAPNTKEMLQLYTSPIVGYSRPILRAWVVSVNSAAVKPVAAGLTGWDLTCRILGWQGLSDDEATEEAFADLVEDVLDVFKAPDLGLSFLLVGGVGPASLVSWETVLFPMAGPGSVLATRAEISLSVPVDSVL